MHRSPVLLAEPSREVKRLADERMELQQAEVSKNKVILLDASTTVLDQPANNLL